MMTKQFIVLSCLLCVSFASQSVALAEESAQPSSTQKVRTDSQGRRITTVDFEDAMIDGQVKAPDGFYLRSSNSSKARTILDLRKDFRQRMRASGHEGLRAVPMK